MAAQSLAPHLGASSDPRKVARVRALVALVWAVVLALAARDASGELAVGVALLVAAYPLVDVVASLADGARRASVAVGVVAAAALAAVGVGSGDAGLVLGLFGAWAAVSGLLQLGAAWRRREGAPMLVSGGLSTLAGVSFVVSSGAEAPSLVGLAGYAAFGAVLFLVWARRARLT